MICAKHQDREAAGNCVDCGRGLCVECLNEYTMPLCHECASIRSKEVKSEFIKFVVISAILFIIALSGSTSEEGFLEALLRSYFIAAIPWGWKTLGRITPDVFLIMPLMGWLIYLMIKLGFAAVIGAFVLPYQVYKGYRELKQLQMIGL